MGHQKKKQLDVKKDESVEKEEKKLVREKRKLLKKLRFVQYLKQQSTVTLNKKQAVQKKRRRKKAIPESLTNYGDFVQQLNQIQTSFSSRKKQSVNQILERKRVSKRALKYVTPREHERVQSILINPDFQKDPVGSIVSHLQGNQVLDK
eukprot:TRINITY_DN2494_c0_g1_i1.p1 TRINITY_DN2494_c0_g1~~TRINITY_DN2494_c0_g1_i1.p1  ORF type:complete len:149 (-),score=10.26 TRINITY_DN2494_c0_g1_i1:301-747(-)